MIRRLFAGFYQAPQVGGMEAMLARIMLALVIAQELWDPGNFPTQESPVGLARWFDLTWLAQPVAFQIFRATMYALVGVYAWGAAMPVVLPLATLGHTLMFTLLNSQGQPHHGHQVVSLVLLAQSMVVLFHHFFRTPCMRRPDDALNGSLLWYTIAVVCGAYMVSAITKVTNSGGDWLWSSENVALDLIKARRQRYYGKLYPWDAGDPGIAIWLLNHPWMSRMVFTGGMLAEFFAFLALGGRKLAFIMGAGLIAMHRGIAYLMALDFRYFEWIDCIFFINAPFLLAWCILRARNRRKVAAGPLPS